MGRLTPPRPPLMAPLRNKGMCDICDSYGPRYHVLHGYYIDVCRRCAVDLGWHPESIPARR